MDSSNISRLGQECSLPPPVASPTRLTGTKRPAPAASLLPPLEFSSSPGLPRPTKRQNLGHSNSASLYAQQKYPTPIPTSTTGILSSSPPRNRPGLNRTLSERQPLGAVPRIELPENGELITIGRSSHSSTYQISANVTQPRLVSRVHVTARCIPATGSTPAKVQIVCEGWNGLTLRCLGRTEELFKGDSFTSSTEGTEIMVDVQEARVIIQWPGRGTSHETESVFDESPRRREQSHMSPVRRNARIASPESPTSRLGSSHRQHTLLPLGDDLRQDGRIEIFEDEAEDEELDGTSAIADPNVSMRTDVTASFAEEDFSDEEKDPNEENDPIVHSFGPFGGNISGRLASMMAKSPARRPVPQSPVKKFVHGGSPTRAVLPSSPPPLHRRVSSASPVSSAPSSALKVKDEDADFMPASPTPALRSPSPPISPSIANHVLNQLAFSRLSSTPLSTILSHLPTEARANLTAARLRSAIETHPAIGLIERQGKDAAGKALESEYYYVAEGDEDNDRKVAVEGMRKPSLRACRKQHKHENTDIASHEESPVATMSEQSLPSHPAAEVSSPSKPPANSRPSATAPSMASTAAWKPSLDRRQSWNKEDQKRDLQMTGVKDVQTGPGFTEHA